MASHSHSSVTSIDSSDSGTRAFLRTNLWWQRRTLIPMVILSCAAAVSEGIGLGLIIPFIQGLTDLDALPIVSGIGFVDNYVLAINAEPLARLYRLGFVIVIAAVVRAYLTYHAVVLSAKSYEGIVERIRNLAFETLQTVGIAYYTATPTGHIISWLNNEIQRLRIYLATVFRMVVRGWILAVYVVGMFAMSFRMTLFVLVVFGSLFLLLSRMMKWVRSSGQQVTLANASYTAQLSEIVHGAKTIAAFGMHRYERRRYSDEAGAVRKAGVEMIRRQAMVTPAIGIGTVLVLVTLTLFSTEYLILTGAMKPALLLTFLFALFRTLPLIQELNNMRGQLAVNRSALSAVTELLSLDNKPVLQSGRAVPGALEKGIEFRNVSFEYEPGKPVLKNISCSFPVGKTTAIVGGSGAGKTTMVDLIARFYDPTSGAIYYDSVDLRDLDIAALRLQISIVSQETHLFHDTIGANIAYGAPSATDGDIRAAAEEANILEFIESLPDGMDTLAGDNGVRLSGGQKQRIAIARAMIHPSGMLILDEATSALDSVSEKLVQTAIERAMENHTVVVIAHRLSTVEQADWIIVLEHGKVAEQGTFDELIGQKGHLWQYYSLQSMRGKTSEEALRIVRPKS